MNTISRIIVMLVTVIAVTFAVITLRNHRTDAASWGTERATLQNEIETLNLQRKYEVEIRKKAEEEAQKQALVSDSLSSILESKRIEIERLRRINKEIIDSVKQIPPQTAYRSLQARYDFGDTSPLVFPFSAPQVTAMHVDVITLDLLTVQYSLTVAQVEACESLVASKGVEIDHFKTINASLENDILLANRHISLQYKVYGIEQTRLRRNFWFATTAAVILGVAALW